jgi:hypothetical protein
MGITREAVRAAFESYAVPQGECGLRAFEVVERTLGVSGNPPPTSAFRNWSEVLTAVDPVVRAGRVAILWLDTGQAGPESVEYRALHFFVVFQVEPMEAFTIWPSPGAAFEPEEQLRERAERTILFQGHIDGHLF